MTRSPIAVVALLLSLFALAAAPALAQTTPVWRTPDDAIAVLSTGTNHDFAYAIVRDNNMRGHNTYCVTVGAHVGKLTVIAIGAGRVVLSNGRVLQAATSPAPASAVAAAGKI